MARRPEGAPAGWSNRSTAILALAALGLRTVRTVALAVRAGWAVEAWADVRRLGEAAGHAREVAADGSGQYAENWLHGRGKAGKPRAAFGSEDALWKLMSGLAHADFRTYANLSAAWDDERGLIHNIGPHRDSLGDNAVLWLASRQLIIVLAAVLTVHDHLGDTDFLAAVSPMVEAEDRLAAELEAAHSQALRSRRG